MEIISAFSTSLVSSSRCEGLNPPDQHLLSKSIIKMEIVIYVVPDRLNLRSDEIPHKNVSVRPHYHPCWSVAPDKNKLYGGTPLSNRS